MSELPGETRQRKQSVDFAKQCLETHGTKAVFPVMGLLVTSYQGTDCYLFVAFHQSASIAPSAVTIHNPLGTDTHAKTKQGLFRTSSL